MLECEEINFTYRNWSYAVAKEQSWSLVLDQFLSLLYFFPWGLFWTNTSNSFLTFIFIVNMYLLDETCSFDHLRIEFNKWWVFHHIFSWVRIRVKTWRSRCVTVRIRESSLVSFLSISLGIPFSSHNSTPNYPHNFREQKTITPLFTFISFHM